MLWKLTLASPDSAELKLMHRLSHKRPAHSRWTLLLCYGRADMALGDFGLELRLYGRGQLDVSIGVSPMP